MMEYFEIRTDLTPKLNVDVKTLTVRMYIADYSRHMKIPPNWIRLLINVEIFVSHCQPPLSAWLTTAVTGFGGDRIM